MNKVLVCAAFVLSSNSAFAWKLVSDPYPTAATNQPTHCNVYFDSAQPVKVPVVTTGGKHCELDLSTVTLSNGTHTSQATHLIDHPVSPLESDKSNTVTFVWPIPSAPTGTLQAPTGWKLVP